MVDAVICGAPHHFLINIDISWKSCRLFPVKTFFLNSGSLRFKTCPSDGYLNTHCFKSQTHFETLVFLVWGFFGVCFFSFLLNSFICHVCTKEARYRLMLFLVLNIGDFILEQMDASFKRLFKWVLYTCRVCTVTGSMHAPIPFPMHRITKKGFFGNIHIVPPRQLYRGISQSRDACMSMLWCFLNECFDFFLSTTTAFERPAWSATC